VRDEIFCSFFIESVMVEEQQRHFIQASREGENFNSVKLTFPALETQQIFKFFDYDGEKNRWAESHVQVLFLPLELFALVLS
jgi:hypothetical protein